MQMRLVLRALGAVSGVVVLYVITYCINSWGGGYWLVPERDGMQRYPAQYGGMAYSNAVLWQPRFGHYSLDNSDLLGSMYRPLIIMDRRWLHETFYMEKDIAGWTDAVVRDGRYHPAFSKQVEAKYGKSASP